MNKQKEDEIEVATFFIGRLNALYDLDYKIFPNDENKNGGEKDVDVYGRSTSKEELKLQLTTSDAEVLRKEALMVKEYKKDKKSKVFISNLTPEYCIKLAIENKKLHSGKEDVCLIIHSEYSGLVNKDYARKNFPRYNNSAYQAVYWVLMPSNNSSHPHSGQIVAIKNYFGEDGAVF